MSKRTMAVVTVGLGLILQLGWAAQSDAQEVTEIKRWGNPATRFSDEPADSEIDLQRLAQQYESDLRTVLGRIEGLDPDDFFRAIEVGAAEPVSVPVGTEYQWMAFRKNRELTTVERVRWAGRGPFDAWRVVVDSTDAVFAFVMPKVCLNITLESKQAKEPPTCELEATGTCPNIINISATTNADEIDITSVRVGGSSGDMGNLRSTGTNRWAYRADRPVAYEFTATARSGSRSGTCSATVDMTKCEEPTCVISASVDPEATTISIDASGSKGEVTLSGYTRPDGEAGDVGAVVSSGQNRWQLDLTDMRRRKRTGSWAFNAVARLNDMEATCTATTVVPEPPGPEYSYVIRGYGAQVQTEGDETLTNVPLTTGQDFRNITGIDNGTGFGINFEWRATRLLGLEFDFMQADLDTFLIADLGPLWEMGEDDLRFRPITAGVNFHVTGDSYVDFYLGPVIGLAGYNDVDVGLFGGNVNIEFDDEFVFGLNLGLDVPFSREGGWLFTDSVKYLDTTGEGDLTIPFTAVGPVPEVEVDVTPFIGRLGIGYRF